MQLKHGYTGTLADRLLQAAKPVSRSGGILLGLTIVSAVAAADYWLLPTVQLTAMYVIAAVATAWCATRRDAVLVALLSALLSTAVQLLQGALVAQASPLMLTLFFRFISMAIVAVLVAEVRALTERYEELSMRDELTSLFNRRALIDRLEIEIARAQRHSTPLALLYADVDLFKGVNDRFGHATGDEFLMRIAEVMELTVRPADIAARMGGDEFVVVLPETDEAGAKALAERLTDQLAGLEGEYGTGLSIGIAAFPVAPESASVALNAADADMYAIKLAREIARLKTDLANEAAQGQARRQSTT